MTASSTAARGPLAARVQGVRVGRWTAASWPPWLFDAGASWIAGRVGLAGTVLFAALLGNLWGHTSSVHFNRWDTEWYVHIAAFGYDSERSANFFPLLPA